MHTQINPVGKMNLLSQAEVDHLQQSATSELYNLFRNCSLAVLNAGSHTDNAEDIYQQFLDFQMLLGNFIAETVLTESYESVGF